MRETVNSSIHDYVKLVDVLVQFRLERALFGGVEDGCVLIRAER